MINGNYLSGSAWGAEDFAGVVSVCHRRPSRERKALVETEKHGSSKPVISVQNDIIAFVEENNNRLGHGVVPANKRCSCPKPLFSVLQICRWCFLTKGTVINDPLNTRKGVWMKYRRVKRKRKKAPFNLRPE